jgi:succinoglycan biosynthesis transport protein ExoP
MEYHSDEKTTVNIIAEYGSLLWHWAWLLALLAVIAGGSSYFLSSRQTPIYTATAMAMINMAPNSQDYTSLYVGQQLADSYSKIMITRTVLDAVAQRLGLEKLPGSVQVMPIANTQLLTVIVTDTDPQRAALIANTLVTVFSEQIQADQASRYADSKQNLKSQMDVLEQQIQTTSADLAVLAQEIQLDTTTLANLLKTDNVERTQEELDQRAALIAQTQTTLQSRLSQQAQMQTVVQNYRTSYAILLQSYESIRLAESQSSSGVLLKDPAVPPMSPTQPQPVRSALLAGLVGLFLGAGIIYLIEYLDDSIRDPQEITRKWGVPVLGIIIRFKSNGSPLVTMKQPRSPVSEAFRSLRTNLEFAAVDTPLKSILVTSASPQDGKTTIAANLACVIAQSKRNVVVLDADLRRPQVHKLFQLMNRIGLTNKLVQPKEQLSGSLQNTELPTLKVITSGSLPPDPSELLGSARMQEMLASLTDQFDYVILDTPPVMLVTDAVVLASRVNGVILVVKPSVTKRAELHHVIDQMKQVNARLLGIVLNEVDVGRSKYIYYRRYYSSYKHKYFKGYFPPEGNVSKEIGTAPAKTRAKTAIPHDYEKVKSKAPQGLMQGKTPVQAETTEVTNEGASLLPGAVKEDLPSPSGADNNL